MEDQTKILTRLITGLLAERSEIPYYMSENVRNLLSPARVQKPCLLALKQLGRDAGHVPPSNVVIKST